MQRNHPCMSLQAKALYENLSFLSYVQSAVTQVIGVRGVSSKLNYIWAGEFSLVLCAGSVQHSRCVSCPVLTPQVGPPLIGHAGGQGAVVGWSGAKQDVVGHGLVQHGAVRAGIG